MIVEGTIVKFKTYKEIKEEFGDSSGIYVRTGWTGAMKKYLDKYAKVTTNVVPTNGAFSIEGTTLIFADDMVEKILNITSVGCRYGISSVDVTDGEAVDYLFKVHASVRCRLKIGDTVVAKDTKGIRLMTVTNMEEGIIESTEALGEIIQKVDYETHIKNME